MYFTDDGKSINFCHERSKCFEGLENCDVKVVDGNEVCCCDSETIYIDG